MRSRSPQRNRGPARRHSSKQRSRSGSTSRRKKDSEDRDVRPRNDGRPQRGSGRKDPPRKREFGSKHRNRHHNKDLSESEGDQKDVAQKVGHRRRSRSLDQGKARSRSKSDDQKRSRDARHGKKHAKHHPKSTDAGARNALRHSRKRSGSQKRSRSPEQKRKARESDAPEEQKIQTRPEAGDSSFGLRKHPPPKKKFDQTRLTLNDRFSQFHDGKPIVLDESISIEIERNIEGDEPFVIPNFHPHEVHLPRRSDEGRRPLTTRAEFAPRRQEEAEDEEEYAEKRVVTVMKSRNRDSASDTVWHRLGQAPRGSGEGPGRVPTLFWKDLGRETVIQVPIITSDRGRDADSSEVTSANDRLGRRVVQTRSDPEVRRSDAPEAQFRNRRRLPSSREDPDPRQGNSQEQESGFFRGSSRRFDPQGRRRLGEKFRGNVTSSVKPLLSRGMKPNLRDEEKSQLDELPDFSRRPDKYSYDSWMDKPEMIPRGRSYFEHDNRNEDMPWVINRGRGGRGGFVRGGRGSGGGRGFGGRGAMPRSQNVGFRKRSRSADSLEWKHDKFETLEEEKPSSTTEK